jgi:predicted Zn-dependent peptidase
LGIYAGTSPANVEQVLDLLIREISQIRSQGIKLDELQRTKDQIKGSVYLSLESVSNRMTRLGKTELCLDRVIDPDEVIEKVEAIQQEDVLALAAEIFKPENFAAVTIGPEDQLISLSRFQSGQTIGKNR